MQRLTNLTNSPHPVTKLDGSPAIIPAFDSIEGEFNEAEVSLLVLVGAVLAADVIKPKRRKESQTDE